MLNKAIVNASKYHILIRLKKFFESMKSRCDDRSVS